MRPFQVMVVLALSALLGCDKKDPPPAAAADGATTTATSASPADAEAPGAADAGASDAGEATLGDMLGLGPRLAAEEKARTTTGLRAEDVFATMREAGATFDAPKQHLATVWKAIYCVAAVNPAEDFVIDVCEYGDEKSAKETEGTSRKGFGAVPGREVHRNGTTLLTLRNGKPTPASVALAKKLVEAFGKMKPKAGPGAATKGSPEKK